MTRLIMITFIFLSLSFPSFGATKTEPVSVKNEPPLEHMLGSMLMFGFRGYLPDEQFLRYVAEGKISGFILFDKDLVTGKGRNIQSPEKLRELTATLVKNAKTPPFIGLDQEGGQIRRLSPQNGFMDLPSAQRMGQGNPAETSRIADQLGQQLHGLGINLDLAPVVDVDSNPFNPAIGKLGRAFNTDPLIVARHALAFGRGLAKNNVIPTLKHFPGLGCANKDPHNEPVEISQCWNPDVDLMPYNEIIQAGWPGMIMVGHIKINELDPILPATLSRNIVTGLLREGLKWDGVVISDDLQMKSVSDGRDLREIISLAVNAGVDILLFANNLNWDSDLPKKAYDTLYQLVNDGIISVERVKKSWQRISSLHSVYTPKEN